MPSQTQPMSALDSLRTVEFRQTLRGYHIDDVDEYLERVALEAEALQEQLRQSAERMRQATDRIAQLEQAQRGSPAPASPASPPASDSGDADDSLKRTLLLAQKFVEQTETEARSQAQAVVEEAQQRARAMLAEAEGRAKTVAQDSERRLRDEVTRLEGLRTRLTADVEAISKHLEAERSRLRGALGEMVRWIDENLAPSTASKGPAERPAEGRSRDEMGAPPPGTGPRPGLQTLSQANTPNGTPR
jgi:cell division initiation protein